MTATISLAGSTQPSRLLDAAAAERASAAKVTTQIDAQHGALATLRENWHGGAATAAAAEADQQLTQQRTLVTKLHGYADALQFGGTHLSALRTQILATSAQARSLGGIVADDGSVSSDGASRLMTPAVTRAYTTVLKEMLTQFDAVDQSTAQALMGTAPTGPAPQFTWTDADLYQGDPSGADINQDGVGDCYLMATMGAIAHANPQVIRDRIDYHPATGEFDVTLWDGRQWRHIAVTQADIDTNIAARGGSSVDTPNPGVVNRNAALWPAVLESAYAKVKAPGDGIQGIDSGLTPPALEALTGNNGDWIIPATEWFTTQHIDTQITEAMQNNQPVMLSTSVFGGDLASQHVYAIEGIAGTGSDATVTLRNPWGADDGPAVIQARLGDLIGTNPLGGLGLGPTGMINIGRM